MVDSGWIFKANYFTCVPACVSAKSVVTDRFVIVVILLISLTIPDVKVVIDSGREKQFSIPESLAEESGTTAVASRLATISISQASARQREGRTGRVSAGVCFRLYTRKRFEQHLEPFTKPEMLRLDLQQMVLHSLSLSHGLKEESSHPLNLLLGAPDPPPEAKIEQTIRELASQGLVNWTSETKGQPANDVTSVIQQAYSIELTPLGAAVASIPASPRLGRLLFVGLAFRAVEPALSIAALLSVPTGFQPPSLACADADRRTWDGCSDIALQLEAYHEFLNADEMERPKNPQKTLFDLVTRVRNQLKEALSDVLLGSKKPSDDHWESWNTNTHRLGAIAALISNTTPHVAHLVGGMSNFATRDIAGMAKIHPASTNFDAGHRTHWYLYHELRITKVPYLHGTTAVSPLEVALFANASEDHFQSPPSSLSMSPYGLFVVDQWVPVDVTAPSQRDTFLKLRHVLTFQILQQLAVDHRIVLSDTNYHQMVLLVLSAIEEQRLPIL